MKRFLLSIHYFFENQLFATVDVAWHSEHLGYTSVGAVDIVREVIASWRALLLRQSAPLTVSLLEERKRFAVTTVEESPFAAELACSFLADYVADDDPLVAAAAQFETLMLRHALGDEVPTPAEAGVYFLEPPTAANSPA
ncbi:MAG TPA: hypothetical protein VE974_07690 [Thermoanaerobaculia bacterium]|nr:hypothetical protein [Thermoanaerobaculia bacterium]